MTVKKIITIRHVFERDYEIEFRNEEDSFDNDLLIADCMVQSGHDTYGLLTHETVFDKPVSEFRTAKNNHIYDSSLYSVTQEFTHFSVSGDGVNAWLIEGETDTEFEWK